MSRLCFWRGRREETLSCRFHRQGTYHGIPSRGRQVVPERPTPDLLRSGRRCLRGKIFSCRLRNYPQSAHSPVKRLWEIDSDTRKILVLDGDEESDSTVRNRSEDSTLDALDLDSEI